MAKYTCDQAGFEDNYIELSDTWTRREVRDFYQFNGADYLALIAKKVVTCHLVCPGGEPIVDGSGFTDDGLDRIDYRVYGWVVDLPVKHVADLGELSLACGRRLFVTTETKTTQAVADPQN